MEGSGQIERRAADWLARRDGGEWSPEDAAALQTWLAASTAHRVAFLRLEAAWNQAGRLKALGAGVASGVLPARNQWAWAPFPSRAAAPAQEPEEEPAAPVPGQRTRHGATRARWPAAAAAVLLAAASLWGWRQYEQVEPESYRTGVGDLRTLALSDGSAATLSSDSALQVRMSRHGRQLELDRGEAYFDVAKDAARPFAVRAGEHRVVAVGTRFAVRRDGDDVRVVVTEGTVRLESDPVDGRSQPVSLLPAGSIAVANRNGVLVRNGAVADAERQIDWRRGYVVFLDTPLATAAAEFNRYTTRPIVLADAAAAQLRIGGSFRWSNSEVFVSLLEQALPVRAERENDRIVLRSREQ
ncbi:FecR family protein [Tahibacter harae]|uniref:FecR domain-containing protein n=1 Tax=Tahibacter harae TaxID=2963937 RepID=A0ABT1QYT3_9GAMM|nr:FecR domain-containing protein [Tahibacter harae]MCQ4167452.1 FecR domain-containing protein [Tahibacter harae]